MSDTPRTDALAAKLYDLNVGGAAAALALLDGCRKIERELVSGLSEERTQRDAARVIADPHVCDFIRNESAELGGPHGWREIDEDPDGMEAELHYAALRGLIERQPDYVGRFRFTDAAKEFL